MVRNNHVVCGMSVALKLIQIGFEKSNIDEFVMLIMVYLWPSY